VVRALAVAALVAAGRAGAAEPGATSSRDVYRVAPLLDGAVIAAATAANVVPWLLEDRIIDERCPCDPAEVPRWERFAIGKKSAAADLAANATLVAASVGPAVWSAFTAGSAPAFWHDAVVLAEATLVTGALTTTTKYFIWQRPIPLAYAGDPAYEREPGSYRAFWSGHTSTVAASLTAWAWTVRLRDGATVWPFLVAAGTTASVGIERVAGGQHFPSDVLVGALAGGAVGTAVPLLHARGAERRVTLVPRSRGMTLVAAF
jgi:membrane-associated phospholipid phosphatase